MLTHVIRISSLLIIALFISAPSEAQDLKGKIISISGEPVSGAEILLENSFTTAVSGSKGEFSISVKSPGEYKVTITHISFEKKVDVISSSTEATITLYPKIYLSEEVNINSTRVNNKTGADFTNFTKAEIEKQNLGQDIPPLLNYTPSVVSTSDAGNGIGYTGIRIRGSDGTRVNVTLNGIPVNDAESHQVYWVNLPDLASSIDNIQIQRGVGSSVNGAGAFGGSINIETNKLQREAYGSVSSSVGSFNTFKNTVSFGSGLMANKLAFEGRLSKITSDGYIDRASANLKSFYLSGGYYGNKTTIKALIISGQEKTYQAWYGVPQEYLDNKRTYNPAGEYYDADGNIEYYENQTDNYQQDYYQLLMSHSFNSQWTASLNFHLTKGKGYYEEFKEDAAYSQYKLPDVIIGNDTATSTDLIRQLWLDNNFYGLTWSLERTSDKLDWRIGGAANQYDGKHFREVISGVLLPQTTLPYRYSSDDATKKDVNAYLKATYRATDKFTAWADLQQRMVNYSYIGLNTELVESLQDVTLNFFNPKAGINCQLQPSTEVYASVAVAHKEPVRDDFLASPANKLPSAEKMTDYEAGVRYAKGKLAVNLNFFYMNYSNQLILTGRINEVGEYIRENVKDSYRKGIEAEVRYSILQNLSIGGNATFSRNKIKRYTEVLYDGITYLPQEFSYDNTNISFSPELITAGIISWSPVKNLTADFLTKYVGEQFLDNTSNSNRKIDAYLLNDIRLNYSLKVKHLKGLDFRLMLNNVFDKKYVSNGSTYPYFESNQRTDYNYYYPQAGVNLLVGVEVRF